MHGEGIFDWQDGRLYIGSYYEDEKSGSEGIYRFQSGKILFGTWKHGMIHGLGY